VQKLTILLAPSTTISTTVSRCVLRPSQICRRVPIWSGQDARLTRASCDHRELHVGQHGGATRAPPLFAARGTPYFGRLAHPLFSRLYSLSSLSRLSLVSLSSLSRLSLVSLSLFSLVSPLLFPFLFSISVCLSPLLSCMFVSSPASFLLLLFSLSLS